MNLSIKPNMREVVKKMLMAHAACVCADISAPEHLDEMAKVLNNSMYELGVITGTVLSVGLTKESAESESVGVVIIDAITKDKAHVSVFTVDTDSISNIKEEVLDSFQSFANIVLEKFTKVEEVIA